MKGITTILLCVVVVAVNARELPKAETAEDLSLDDVVDKVRLFSFL